MTATLDAPRNGALAPSRDLEAERAVLGCMLITDRVIEPIATETGLTPEHFTTPEHAQVWHAALRIIDRGDHVDIGTLHHELAGEYDRDWLDQLAAHVDSVANARAYARRVVDAHRWERARQAHLQALAAIAERNEDALTAAEADATRVVAKAAGHLTNPEALGTEMARVFSEPGQPGLPLPWTNLAKKLRLRRRHTTAFGGWTSIGKSMCALELAEHVGREGLHVVFWTNEMSREDLAARTVQRATGLDANLLLDRAIPADQGQAVLTALRDIPYGVVEAFGWTANDIARHIRHVKPDLAILDHFHALPGAGKNETAEEAVQVLVAAAQHADTHLLIVCQLNSGRDHQLIRPAPTSRDLRGTGALQSLPNNIVFFHRDQEEVKDPITDQPTGRAVTTDRGVLHVDKQRGGPRDVIVPVHFDKTRLHITEGLWR